MIDLIHNAKACIFDLDGTLLDSMQMWQDIDREYLARFNIEFTPDISEDIKTMTFNESAMYFKKRFDLPMSVNQIQADWNSMVEHQYAKYIPLKAGVKEYLSHINKMGMKMCIATSCNLRHANMALERLGIASYFSFVVTCGELHTTKEESVIFTYCAKRMQLAYEEIVVFEDLYTPLKKCKEKGFLTVGVFDKMNEKQQAMIQSICTCYIYDFHELIEEKVEELI